MNFIDVLFKFRGYNVNVKTYLHLLFVELWIDERK